MFELTRVKTRAPGFLVGLSCAASVVLIAWCARSVAVAPPPNAQQPRDDDGPAERLIISTLKNVEQAKIQAKLEHLVSYPTRHTLSTHNVDATKWLAEQFRAMGYEDVSLHDFRIKNKTRHNVFCAKPARGEAGKLLIVSAHFDSRMNDLDDSRTTAPGADDNASGIAALLEAARVLKTVDLNWTIRFCAFSGEEQGMVGSKAYAQDIRNEGLTVSLVINMDMVGHPENPERPAIIVEHDQGNHTRKNDKASRDFASRMVRAARFTKLKAKEGPIYASDYMPFEALGVPCIGLFDGADQKPFYHQSSDDLTTVDVAFCTEATRLLVATILDITRVP
jgi:hypothetical protein